MNSCNKKSIKFFLYFFNFLFMVSGIGIIIVGSIIISKTRFLTYFNHELIYTPTIILVVTGCLIVLVISFLGWCGASRESPGMLITYGVLLLLILIQELVAGITSATNVAVMEQIFQDSRAKYYTDDTVRAVWDEFHQMFKCCGVHGPKEFGVAIPPSCCIVKPIGADNVNPFCTEHGRNKNYLSSGGCYEAVKWTIYKYPTILLGISIGIVLIEVFGIILAFWLAVVIKRERLIEDY